MKSSALNKIALSILLSLPVATVYAQQDANTQESNNNKQIEDKLYESITVVGSRLDRASSATGLALTLRQTPQSISIIDSEFIDNFALETLADVLAFAPGIQAQQAETDRFFFRARGREVTNFQFDGVPVVYDSFFSDAITDTIIFDRVEIVRGATGLLTGAGEPSAAINLIRKRPTINDGGYVSLQAGSWNTQRLELDHSQTLNESGSVKGRFAAAYEQGESYVNLTKKKNLQVYGVVTADITENTRLTVGLDHSDRDPTSSTWGALPLFYADGTQTDDLPVSTTTAASWTAWARTGTNAFAQIEHAFENEWNVQFEVERRENEMDGNLLYLFGNPDKVTGIGLGAFPLVYLSEREQTAVRAQATGPFELFGRDHTLTSGLLYSKEDVSADSFGATEQLTIPSLFDCCASVPRPTFSDTPFSSDTTETQKGVYAAAQLNVHDNWTLILGNRVSSFTTDSATESNITDHSNVSTPYLGLVYDLLDNVSVYTSYTEIFQPQSARNVNNERLDPTEGSNIELGVKGDFLNEKLTASFAVYKVEEDNVAAPDPLNTNLLPDGSLPNIGIKGAQTTGFEVELNGKPSEEITVYLSYTHNDAEKADGEALSPYLPDNMLRTSAIYEYNEQTQFGVNVNWQSDISLPDAGPNGETYEQDSYTLVSVMGSYEINRDWKVNANINNLFDKKYLSSIDFFNQGFYGAPRNFEVSVRYSW